jgi:hypothetical protein
VLWTNLPCSILPPGYETGCATVDQALMDAQARHEDLHVLDWAAVADGHPEWVDPDGVHYTHEGSKAYADFLRDALDAIVPAVS